MKQTKKMPTKKADILASLCRTGNGKKVSVKMENKRETIIFAK
jgi:hypothetical protein